MAKRFQPLKEFGRTTKKPKLDISINRGSATISRGRGREATGSRPAALSNTPSPVKCSPIGNNLWDDDDDDVILLATQVAESQAVAAGIIADSELTFSEFAPNVQASTSTQRLPVMKATIQAPDRDFLSQMFDNDDDDEFALMAAAKIEKMTQAAAMPIIVHDLTISETEEDNIFKKPNAPIVSSQIAAGTGTCDISMRRQLAAERKEKFLMERLEVIKKENAKLSKDLDEAKSKMQIKDGESSLLRDELRHMKQQMEALKIEKFCTAEAAKAECKSKIATLSHQVEAKESELRLKAAEYSMLKIRHADESRRFDMTTMLDGSMSLAAAAAAELNAEIVGNRGVKGKKKITRKLQRLCGLQLGVEQTPPSPTTVQLYEDGNNKVQRTVFQEELKYLQTLHAQLQLLQQQQQHLSDADNRAYTSQVVASVNRVLPEFWTYVHSLEFPKSCRVHPYHDYELSRDASTRTNFSLLQPARLYDKERAISLRRYLATLAVSCQLLPALTLDLLSHQHGEYALLQIANDAIGKLSYARELCEHFGVLEACARLLRQMLVRVCQKEADVQQPCIELLVGLLKQLVFARPSAWIFRELSHCLLLCTELPAALALLCANSDARNFVSDRVKSLYRYSGDSCVLQVYAGLLEIAFPLASALQAKHLHLLAVICALHVRFVFRCFEQPPKFLHRLLPCYDEDDEDDDDDVVIVETPGDGDGDVEMMTNGNNNKNSNNNSNGNGTPSTNSTNKSSTLATTTISTTCAASPVTCECYTKLCLSVVTLLFQLLRQWLRADKLQETSRVAEISRISVQLLYIIFCDNYLTCLFREAEETTKHYLCLICKWWTEHAELLQFNEIQLNFLHKLKNSHVMPKQFSDEEENPGNIVADLGEWSRFTVDAVDATHTDGRNVADALRKLQIMETAGNADTFFEGLNSYADDFQ